jgi:hypothetical protein
MKNVLAAVGLVVIAKTGYELYRKYRELERENAFWRASATRSAASQDL